MSDLNAAVISLTAKVDNMQSQLNKLTTVIESLARIEERVMSQKSDVDGFGRRLNDIEARLRKIEVNSAINTSDGQRALSWVERLIWLIVSGAVASIMYFKK